MSPIRDYGRRVSLNEGTNPTAAVQVLSNAAMQAGNVLGTSASAIDLFNHYLAWATTQERSLANMFPQREVERLLTTRRYWTIQTMDPIAYGAALRDLIHLEVNARVTAFNAAKEALESEIAVWNPAATESSFSEQLHAVVVDTNVLMRSKGAPTTTDWSALAGTRPTQSLAITIPAVVIEELDDLKHSNGKMTFDGESHDRRWLATLALRWLQNLFPSDGQRAVIREAAMGAAGPIPQLYAVLMFDPLDHISLPKPDSEIIDTALRLQPFAKSVSLVSYDAHMIFTARHLGLRASMPQEEADVITSS